MDAHILIHFPPGMQSSPLVYKRVLNVPQEKKIMSIIM